MEFDKLRSIEISGEHIIGGVPQSHPIGSSDTDSDTEAPTNEVNGRPLNYHELADIFPPSLETLRINSPGQSPRHFMPLLVEIARACKMEKRLPNLKTVDAEQCFIEQSSTRHQALLDQTAGFFTDAGVVFLPPEFIGSIDDERGMYPTYWGGSDDDYGSGDSYDGEEWFDEDDPYAGFI